MKTTREQYQLHCQIWKTANALRGSIDGWSFKSYIFGIMFYRYLSESLSECANAMMSDSGYQYFDYTHISDKEAEGAQAYLVSEKGFFILPSQLFCNVCANNLEDEYLNERLGFIFRHIEMSAIGTPSEHAFEGIFSDVRVDNVLIGRDARERSLFFAKVLRQVASFDFAAIKDDSGDINVWGDAFQYLLNMYSSAAGRSGGAIFTPLEVSELLTRIAVCSNPSVHRVYDPACGTGSLLLKFRNAIDNIRTHSIKYYGQDKNTTCYNISRINMLLHGVNLQDFDIRLGDTLVDPKHMEDAPFDAIVCNPPFSMSWEGDRSYALYRDERFEPSGTLAPQKAADLAFVMHMLHHLSANGTAAIVAFPGVLYRGGAEQVIRSYLIEENFVDTVVQLPENMFFGTGVAPCVLVLRKDKRAGRNILFIDASRLFVKEWRRNRMSKENQDKILDLYQRRDSVKNLSRLVPINDIAMNDYNLSVASYVWREDNTQEKSIAQIVAEYEIALTEEMKLRDELGQFLKLKTLSVSDNDVYNNKWIAFKEDEVEWKCLYQCCRIQGRIGFRGYSTSDFVSKGEGAMVLGPGNICDGTLHYDDCKYISWEKYEGSPEIMLEKNDIVFCKTGSTVGKVAMVKKLPVHATINPQLVVLKHIQLNPKYLYYILSSIGFQIKVKELTGAGTIPNISQARLQRIVIPVVSAERQQEIVDKLDKLEALVANYKLQQELKQKQYEYYKQQLVAFGVSCEL